MATNGCRTYDIYPQQNSDGTYQGVVHFTDQYLPNYWAQNKVTSRTAAEEWCVAAANILTAKGTAAPANSYTIGGTWNANCGGGGTPPGGDPIKQLTDWINKNQVLVVVAVVGLVVLKKK